MQPSGPKGPTGRNHFIYDVAPGSTLFDYVGVTNLSDRPLTFQVYATDAFTTVDGAFSLRPAEPGAHGRRLLDPCREEECHRQAGQAGGHPVRDQRAHQRHPGRPHRRGDRRGPADRCHCRRAAGPDGPAGRGPRLPPGHRRCRSRSDGRVDGRRIRDADQSLRPYRHGGHLPVAQHRQRPSGRYRQGDRKGPFGWKLAQSEGLALPELLPGSVFTITERATGCRPRCG